MKKTYILYVSFAFVIILFLYLGADYFCYTCISTNVIIDKNLLDKAPTSMNPRKEIDHYLDFAFNYFMDNFDIKFMVKEISVMDLKKNDVIKYKDFKPHHEKFTIIFNDGQGFDSGISETGNGHIHLTITFHEYSNEMQKWVLVHEISHQFQAIDLINEQSVMNGYPYFEISNIVEDGTTVRWARLKEMNQVPQLELDARSRDIINISKSYYAMGIDNLADFSPYSLNQIVDHYDALLPKARHQSDVNYKIAYCYCKNNKFEQALKYALAAVKENGNEGVLEPSGYMGYTKLDDKYDLLGKIYYKLNKRDLLIESLEKSIAINNTNSERLKCLSDLYLDEIHADVWNGELIEKVKKLNEQIIAIDPKNTHPYQVLSMIYMGQDNKEKVGEYLHQLFSMKPTIYIYKKKNGYASIKIIDVTDTGPSGDKAKPGEVWQNVTLKYDKL